MNERDFDSDALKVIEPPDPNDIEATVAFYERIGAMPVNSIGPPIERPIIPPRRPDRVGDFRFTTRANANSSLTPSCHEEVEDPEAERIHREFADMIKDELKGL